MRVYIPVPESALSFEPIIKRLTLRESFSRKEAASLMRMSVPTFSRKFARKFRMTFNRAKILCPMQAAAVVLRKTTMTVSEVAELFHYADLTTFERAFRRFWIASPTGYRQRFRVDVTRRSRSRSTGRTVVIVAVARVEN